MTLQLLLLSNSTNSAWKLCSGTGRSKRAISLQLLDETRVMVIFKALEWADVKNIDLRALEKGAKRSEDPPALGDSYFRY